jgi:large subunit ribosomal protein L2
LHWTVLGKRTLVRRRGKGGKQFQSIKRGKIVPAKYPNLQSSEQKVGSIADIVHEPGRNAPLAKIQFDKGFSYLPAPDGMEVGEKIQIGNNVDLKPNNILALESIPDGTIICNLERNIGDGGKLVKSAGSSALVFSHTSLGVSIKLPSGKFTTLNPKCKAMLGVVAGAGRKEKPFLKAGNRAKYMIAHGKLYPTVRGIAQAAVYHPHGGGRHQHVGRQSSVGRTTPPGRKVGNIAPRKTGRARIKEKHE